MDRSEIGNIENSAKKLSRASHRMMHAACLQAEIEAMKAENLKREQAGKAPAHGFKQFMDAIERWQYDG